MGGRAGGRLSQQTSQYAVCQGVAYSDCHAGCQTALSSELSAQEDKSIQDVYSESRSIFPGLCNPTFQSAGAKRRTESSFVS